MKFFDLGISYGNNDRKYEVKIIIAYKDKLLKDAYAARSINSMLASLNSLFAFLGWTECKVKTIRLQQQIYCSEEKELTKEEYIKLVNTAKQKGKERLYLLLQTICAAGIRVSELSYITVEAVGQYNKAYTKRHCQECI